MDQNIMKKIRIAADDKIPFLAESPLARLAELIRLPGAAITRDDLRGADALITRTRTKCNADLLDGTAVRLIATATIGYDHIDTAYCAAHDILWRNAPGCNADSVAQYIASLLLIHEETKRDPLAGKTIGVVGAGNVGSRLAKVAETLGMRVLLNDPPRERKEGTSDFVSLELIQEEADFITFHVPLLRDGSDRTFHLADAPFFAGLKRTPFLINSSRGEVTDSEALKSALRSGGIRGAALDVWEHEPGIDLELMNLLEFATPHIAGYSADGKANGTAACVRTVAEFFGLEDAHGWYPEIPVPATTHLRVHSLAEAVASAYDVRQDDARLRRSPETFEKQRGNYPLRREFPAFTIDRTSPLKEEQFEILRKLGFQIR